jgi:hypothetical protein
MPPPSAPSLVEASAFAVGGIPPEVSGLVGTVEELGTDVSEQLDD